MPRRNDIAEILMIASIGMLLCALTFGTGVVTACSIIPPVIDVSSDFDVLVVDHGKPVAGIPIEVVKLGVKSDHPLLFLKSDANGRIAITGLNPGEYSVDSDSAMWVPGFIARVDSPKAKQRKKLVEFQWPSFGIARVKALRGRLWSENSQRPFEDVDLRLFLVDGHSASLSQFTGPSGRFEFKDIAPGLYVLWMHAKQPNVPKGFEDEGPIVVRVDPEDEYAPAELDLPIGSTSCGIWYAQCDQHNAISLASRRIRLRDPNGAAVFSAQYVVTDPSGRKIASGLSNQEGIIRLSHELMGAYKLAINRYGFTPFAQPLYLLPYKSGAEEDLNVVLNVGGSCSEAKLENHATPQ